MIDVQRDYVWVDGRQVEFRVAGEGPLVLLLHQSPQSSADFADLMQRWGDRYTLVAADREGYGNSDPLADPAPPLEAFADAVIRFLDVLGIDRVPIYGFHTGATVAIAVASRHPDRVAAIAANGVVAPSPQELAEIQADYLPPFVPRWDGSHLAWLWSRMREQTIFFPWHRRRADARMSYDVSPPPRIQRNVLEFLRCWRTYDRAYGAAFRFDGVAALRELRVPAYVTATRGDPLHPHLQRLVAGPAVRIEPAESALEAEQDSFEFLHGFAAHRPRPRSESRSTGRAWWRAGANALHGIAAGPAEGPRVLIVHDAGDRAAVCTPLIEALAARGFAVRVPDLPGHGDSPDVPAGEDRLAASVRTLRAVLGDWCRPGVTLIGVAHGGPLALVLARALGGAVRRVVLADLPLGGDAVDADYDAPVIDWYGGHLQRAWHEARDAELFHPARARSNAAARRGDPELDDARLTDRVFARLLAGAAGPALVAAVRSVAIAQRLRDAREVVRLVVDAGWPEAAVQRVAALASAEGIAFVTAGPGSRARYEAMADLAAPPAPGSTRLGHEREAP